MHNNGSSFSLLGAARGKEAKRQREHRRRLVAAGNCGFCGKPRKHYAWLCDRCARDHRERQRVPEPETTPLNPNPATFAVANEDSGDTLARWMESIA